MRVVPLSLSRFPFVCEHICSYSRITLHHVCQQMWMSNVLPTKPLFVCCYEFAHCLESTDPVKVVEGSSELVQLLLADALGISRQDLVLDFIDGASNSGEQLLPAHADVLRRNERERDKEVKESQRCELQLEFNSRPNSGCKSFEVLSYMEDGSSKQSL